MRKTNLKNKTNKLDDNLLKKIYNPMYYNIKPKYRVPMSNEENKIFKKAIYNLYNPKIKETFRLKDAGIVNLFAKT